MLSLPVDEGLSSAVLGITHLTYWNVVELKEPHFLQIQMHEIQNACVVGLTVTVNTEIARNRHSKPTFH